MALKLSVWIWPFLLTGIVYVGTYLYTKNKTESLRFSFYALLLSICCFSIIEFEIYLESIFVGHYNNMGMPSHFSHSGWRLMLDAWPIWVVPLYLALLIKAFFVWAYMIFQSVGTKPAPAKGYAVKEKTFSNTQNQLAMQEMQQRLDATTRRYEAVKSERYHLETRIKQLELALGRASQNPGSESTHHQALQAIIDEQHSEITQANELIEHLLQDLYSKQPADESSDDFF